MAARGVSFSDLSRPPREVAVSLPEWARGDHDEAVAQTLAASGRELHARAYVLWVWRTGTEGGDEVWVLPVTTTQAAAFAPRGPAAVLVRAIAAGIDAGAVADGVRLLDWHGFAALELPGADGELAALALTERNPSPARVAVAELPPDLLEAPPEVMLAPTARRGDGLSQLAAAAGVHPVEVALSLAEHGQPIESDRYPAAMVDNLRTWGLAGTPPPPSAPGAPPGIADDPCPRRRHARRVLQRLLRMGKVGTGYHTAVDHLYRGAPADQRRDALEVGEALIRAGLLGEKPSVGQRHVYLRREALPAIHALIERGETRDADLAQMWTAAPPEQPG